MWEARRSLSSIGLTYDDRSLPGTESQPCACLSAQDGKAVFRGWQVESRGTVCFRSTEQGLPTYVWKGPEGSEDPVGFMFVSF